MAQTKTKALIDLKVLLYAEKEWVKVHVAEFLLWEGHYVDDIRGVFLKEEAQYAHIPKYRIGIWRVLAQVAKDDKEGQYWIDKIIGAYQDTTGEDRLHAIETLAKLQIYTIGSLPIDSGNPFYLYSLWNYSLGSTQIQQEVKDILIKNLLDDKRTELETQVTSYILRYMDPLSKEEFYRIESWMSGRGLSNMLMSHLLATLFISRPKDLTEAKVNAIKQKLICLRHEIEAIPHIMMAFSAHHDPEDRKFITELFNKVSDKDQPEYSADLHATAAYMILKTF